MKESSEAILVLVIFIAFFLIMYWTIVILWWIPSDANIEDCTAKIHDGKIILECKITG